MHHMVYSLNQTAWTCSTSYDGYDFLNYIISSERLKIDTYNRMSHRCIMSTYYRPQLAQCSSESTTYVRLMRWDP
jgi:hypothetical protein